MLIMNCTIIIFYCQYITCMNNYCIEYILLISIFNNNIYCFDYMDVKFIYSGNT